MDDKWESVRVTLVLVVNSCWPRGRCKGNAEGKIRNSRQAAMISGKQICVSCNVFVGFKTLGLNKDSFLDRLYPILYKV